MTDKLAIPAELKPVNMNVHRCYECGRCWALETFANGAGICPCCAQRRIDALELVMKTKDRVINALRGVLARRRR